MVAGSHLSLDEAGGRPNCQRDAHEHIVEAPPDVPLSQVAPGRPPGEEMVVVRVEGATQVHQAATQDPLNQRALLRKLSNRPGLALFRMYIKIRSRYVHIPAQHELAYFSRILGLERRGVLVERFEESHFRREVSTTVGHIDRPDGDTSDFRHNDSILAIERGMNEQRLLGRDFLADVKTDARVAFAAVPIAPVPLHLTQCRWHLVGLRLDLLQADDIRTLALDPLLALALTGPDPTDIPGRELNGLHGQISAPGNDNNQHRCGGRVCRSDGIRLPGSS